MMFAARLGDGGRGTEGDPGDDAVAVAAVERVDVFDGVPFGVGGEPLEEQGGGEFGHTEQSGLRLRDDRGLDGLDRLMDLYLVMIPQVLVEVPGLQFLLRQIGYELCRDVQMLDGDGGAVDQSKPCDVDDRGGGGELQFAAHAGAGLHGRELKEPT